MRETVCSFENVIDEPISGVPTTIMAKILTLSNNSCKCFDSFFGIVSR